MSRPPKTTPLAVNYHLWPKCNLQCTFCYAGFPQARKTVPTAQSLQILDQLAAAGTDKITFVGGEPTLHPDLALLVRHAADLGMTTCIVTNGAKLLAVLDAAPGAVHWVGLSVDSANEATQATLGRGRGDHVGKSVALAAEIRRRGIRLKLNTVVTALNCDEDLSDMVRAMEPERWKAFQVLRIEGENDGRVEPLLISGEVYRAFVQRHEPLRAEGLGLVAEDNDAMLGSYVMINPEGCFFSNETGSYTVSEPILNVGVAAALAQVGWRDDKFVARGGLYAWRDTDGTRARPPIIAIEGLDGSGKSTTVRLLAAELGAVVIRNPPEELAADRVAADALPPSERRAWYLGANRRAMELAMAVGDRPVVLDRSVVSTLVFGAAEQGAVAGPGDVPTGFPMPDAIALLAVPEALRVARHHGRGDGSTREEERLAVDAAFRERVLLGYRALCSVVVDASGSPMEVVATIQAHVATLQVTGHQRGTDVLMVGP